MRGQLIGRRVASLLAASYLLAQMAVPLVVQAKSDRIGGDFSWDMFSHALRCPQIDCITRVPGGPWQSVPLTRDFSSMAQLSRVLLPGRVDAYARHLCEAERDREGSPVELRFVAECRQSRDGPAVSLVDAERDYCSGSPR